MAANDTPPFGTYLRAAKSVPSAIVMNDDSSSDDDEAHPLSSKKPVTQPRPIPRSVPVSFYPSNQTLLIEFVLYNFAPILNH